MINKFNYILDIFDKLNDKCIEISIIYEINKKNIFKTNLLGDERSKAGLKILNSSFVNRYKHFCKIIYEDIEYELDDYFTPLNYKNKNYDKDTLEIKLRGIRYITDMSYMFNGCSSLQSLPDISKWNTSNITNMSYMSNGCSSLKTRPDISKWKLKENSAMDNIFLGCPKRSFLSSLFN